MIHVDQALCAGCGVCVDECPSGAIMLDGGAALVAPALCNDCGACVEICPTGALTQVIEPTPSLLPVVLAETRERVPRRRAVLPAVGGALVWMGREVVPRLAPLALDVLDNALNRGARAKDRMLVPTGRNRGRGRRGRRHRRRGRRLS